MATARGVFGPELADPGAYITTMPPGFSIVSTPAPAHGTYRLKATGTTSDVFVETGVVNGAYTLAYRWICLREFRLSGTLNAGQEVHFLRLSDQLAFSLSWAYATSSTYSIKLYDDRFGGHVLIGTSGGTFGTAADHSLRAQTDGSRFKLWVDGVLEIDVSYALNLNGGHCAYHNDVLAAGQDMYWSGMYGRESVSESERPDVNVKQYALHPDGDGSSALWADETCSGSGGTYTKWDDWVSGGAADDATSFNCGVSGFSGSEISTLATATISNPANAAVAHRARGAANVASKTVNVWPRIEDGVGNNQEGSIVNLGDTTWKPRLNYRFTTAPDGGGWTQAKFDDLRAGVKHPPGNSAHAEFTALAIEIATAGDDPPAAAGAARSFGVIVG